MALQDEILMEISAGRLNERWTTADLVANRALSGKFARAHLTTTPPNYSASLQDSVWEMGSMLIVQIRPTLE